MPRTASVKIHARAGLKVARKRRERSERIAPHAGPTVSKLGASATRRPPCCDERLRGADDREACRGAEIRANLPNRAGASAR
jgi:hypothetical protein